MIQLSNCKYILVFWGITALNNEKKMTILKENRSWVMQLKTFSATFTNERNTWDGLLASYLWIWLKFFSQGFEPKWLKYLLLVVNEHLEDFFFKNSIKWKIFFLNYKCKLHILTLNFSSCAFSVVKMTPKTKSVVLVWYLELHKKPLSTRTNAEIFISTFSHNTLKSMVSILQKILHLWFISSFLNKFLVASWGVNFHFE